MIEGSARVPIVLRYSQVDGDPLDKFGTALVNLPDGGHVPLATLVPAQRVEGPVSVKREQGRRFVVVMSNVQDRDLVGFVEEAQQTSARRSACPAACTWNGVGSSKTSSVPRGA